MPKVEGVVVEKGARRMQLLFAGHPVREYRIALGSDPVGAKARLGDGRTPEGRYVIAGRNRASRFHRALRVSYPNASDRQAARAAGFAPGGGIMLHGLPNGSGWVGDEHLRFDWTDGCIAVTDPEMDEIWELVDDGTPIEIRP